MWEVVNEPEGVLNLTAPSPPASAASDAPSHCTDVASVVACAGLDQPGWNVRKGGECLFSLEQLQRFINLQAPQQRLPKSQREIRSSACQRARERSRYLAHPPYTHADWWRLLHGEWMLW